jgi:2-methylcitrate dehydratase PrpD
VAAGLSDALSEYAVEAKLEHLTTADNARMVDAFVNWVGCAAGGAQTNTVATATQTYVSFSSGAAHSALGRTERVGLVEAISLDCLSSAALGYDDTHLETVLHPTGPVASALLGLARTRPISGAAYLEALFVGMEVECRVGLAFASREAGSKRGWYATGLAGGVGAAAAVGRVLGFTADQMRNAYGLAAARACGNRGTHGTMAGAYVPALAAESGFISAQLTAAGFTCGARALDGTNGMLNLVASTPAVSRALHQLGSVSEAANTAFKPYPAGIVVHPVIDACLALVHVHGIQADEIERLELQVPQITIDLASTLQPADEYEAAVSLYHWAAAVLVTGSAASFEAGAAIVKDARIRALQHRIHVASQPSLADDQCKATARTRSGGVAEVFIEHAIGSKDRPMTSEEVDRKFLASAQASYSRDRAEALWRSCRSVLSLSDVRAILEI